MVTERARDRLRSSSRKSLECIYFNVKTELPGKLHRKTLTPWSRDGQAMVVSSMVSPKKPDFPKYGKFHWMEILTQLTHNGGFDGTERPGFSQLVFTRPSTDSQRLIYVQDRNPRSWSWPPLRVIGIGLCLRTASTIFPPTTLIDLSIFTTSRHTASVESLEMSGAIYGGTPSLTISPDGHYLAYAQVDSFNADLVLVRNW